MSRELFIVFIYAYLSLFIYFKEEDEEISRTVKKQQTNE